MLTAKNINCNGFNVSADRLSQEPLLRAFIESKGCTVKVLPDGRTQLGGNTTAWINTPGLQIQYNVFANVQNSVANVKF
jgi:hypothetical protein